MSKQIPLSRGLFALVDDEDFERVSQYKWCIDGNGYVCRMVSERDANGKRVRHKVLLHRFVMDAPQGMEVDHIHHDLLDNRRSSLRVATRYLNHANSRPQKNSTAPYKGIYLQKRDQKWCAQIRFMGKRTNLGKYDNPQDAAKAYDRAALAAWGEFAFLNFPHLRYAYCLSLAIAAPIAAHF